MDEGFNLQAVFLCNLFLVVCVACKLFFQHLVLADSALLI
jgi:hypothetical protein